MERKPIKEAEQPEYPTLKAYRANRREFLKLAGIGIGGMAVGGCFISERTGGVIAPAGEPPPLAGIPAHPEDAPALPGEMALPEDLPEKPTVVKPESVPQDTPPLGGDMPVSGPPKCLPEEPPRLLGKPAPARIRGEMPAPKEDPPSRTLGIIRPAKEPPVVKPESIPPDTPRLDGDIITSVLPE